mmetsp:Transcript_4643/g.7067  ORF Transcript_4643/g.7067 Transcript_4643/m.7067 type:complete len:208 (+) Transcript_4643:1322-1945(+)
MSMRMSASSSASPICLNMRWKVACISKPQPIQTRPLRPQKEPSLPAIFPGSPKPKSFPNLRVHAQLLSCLLSWVHTSLPRKLCEPSTPKIGSSQPFSKPSNKQALQLPPSTRHLSQWTSWTIDTTTNNKTNANNKTKTYNKNATAKSGCSDKQPSPGLNSSLPNTCHTSTPLNDDNALISCWPSSMVPPMRPLSWNRLLRIHLWSRI